MPIDVGGQKGYIIGLKMGQKKKGNLDFLLNEGKLRCKTCTKGIQCSKGTVYTPTRITLLKDTSKRDGAKGYILASNICRHIQGSYSVLHHSIHHHYHYHHLYMSTCRQFCREISKSIVISIDESDQYAKASNRSTKKELNGGESQKGVLYS